MTLAKIMIEAVVNGASVGETISEESRLETQIYKHLETAKTSLGKAMGLFQEAKGGELHE